MSNVTSIFKNKPDPNEYIPNGVVLMAMQWFGESDPQRAWDILLREVMREAYKGDEEVCKKRALEEFEELPEELCKERASSEDPEELPY